MRFIIWFTGGGRLAQECNTRFESGIGFIQVSLKSDQKTIIHFYFKEPKLPLTLPTKYRLLVDNWLKPD